jgi:predicted P-loop ATPase
VAVKQSFHPVRDYLNPLAWDGKPRVDTLFIDYLGVEDSEYTRAVTRKSITGAVARVMAPGCKFDYMLVFVGKQGRGKSSIVYKLAGGEEWFTDSLVSFDGTRACEAVTGKWLVEVPEMHAFDKTTMNHAKAFISKQSDFYRSAYAEFPEDRRRQCVFFGTTNNKECLRDETGGRRFWPLDTDKSPRTKNLFTELEAERDQIWAEAVFYWKMGETLYLPPELEAVASERQEAHREAHPWEDTIKNFVEQSIPTDWDDWDLSRRLMFWNGSVTGDVPLTQRTKVCIREVWQEALTMPLASLDQQKARAISGALNRLEGWEKCKSKRFGKVYGVQKGYVKV